MARCCSIVASLAIGALTLVPVASAAPPGNSSCMAEISVLFGQLGLRDQTAHNAKTLGVPGRAFYSLNAHHKSADPQCD